MFNIKFLKYINKTITTYNKNYNKVYNKYKYKLIINIK